MIVSAPYLSIVVATRNDDHGGNLLQRMQTFVNALFAQCQRYELPAELVIVEWNPPHDRPPLAEVFQWPVDKEFCSVRIIQVPPELHRRFAHWKALPLYQMIAKNAGIRRARGQFILATNIDILFSSELIRFIAGRCLTSGKMYRIDRWDVMPGVSVDAPVEEQLAYCRSHLIRLNTRDGTYRLSPDGHRALEPDDIIGTDAEVSLGTGWFQRERSGDEPFRWVENDAELVIASPGHAERALILDVEPGPGINTQSFLLELRDEAGTLVSSAPVDRRTVVNFAVPPFSSNVARFHLHVEGGGARILSDLRTLNFRVFHCALAEARQAAGLVAKLQARSPEMRSSRGWTARAAHGFRLLREIWRGTPGVQIRVPMSKQKLAKLQLQQDHCGLSFSADFFRAMWRRDSETVLQTETPAAGEAVPVFLHTNACGDFTLMAREHWTDLRGYPEFDLFSMNIDSLFCWTAHHGGAREEVLEDPMRIYHIEHAAGSGWTPEGHHHLFQRIAANNVPWLSYEEVLQWARIMHRFNVPLIFNHEDWGLCSEQLTETRPLPHS